MSELTEAEEPQKERVSVDITPYQKKALRIKVAQQGTTITEVLSKMIDNYLKD
jgi:hypothetical protein